MADYWQTRLKELNTVPKQKTADDYWKTQMTELEEEEEKKKKNTTNVTPVSSTVKKEEEEKPLLIKAIDKVGDFLDNSADVVGKILTGDIFKKEDKDIAPTVSTTTKAEQKDDDDGKFTLKDAASWAGNAAMSGLASFNKGITSTADLLLGKPLQSLGWENNPVSKMADYYDDQYTAWKNETAEDAAKLGGGKGLSIAGDIIESTVAAVPNALAALMSAGASLGASATSTGLQQAALYDSGNLLTKIGMKVTDMAKNPQYWTSFVQTYGTDYEEAKAMGASDTAALYGATISSLLNAGVEIGVDGLSGIQGLPAKVMNGDKGAFLEWVESSLSEGGEEMVQGVISNIVAKVAYDPETKVFDAKEMGKEFAMGTAVGGLLGGGQIAAMKGADAVNNAIQTHEDNKLTENEQKVVDKVVEDRVKEAEKDGEKLTAKEKNKIYEEVENDLEKGYISTDTIEEVLGGETYAEYKNTTDSENALREEFETLGGMKKSDFTAKQDDRYNELKQKLAEIDSGDARNQLKTKLSQEVSALAEGSRLAESYNERGRRGEKFDADLTAYDEKQKAVVQKAIDSGILNNTNRTHEFVDMVAKISADNGVLFDFTNNEKLKGSGFAVDGKTVNGFVNKDGVTVNIDSAKSLNSVVGHEITHVLEGTELYTELQNVVVEYAKTKGDYQGRYDSLTELYKGIEGADIDAELTADLIGDYLFTDADFVNNLSATNRNVFQKIYDEVKYLIKVATAGSKEARELAKVKRAFDKAYKEGGTVMDTKYSLEQVDGVDYVKAENNIFVKEDGTLASEREVFNSLVGKTISLPDGDIKIVKRLPGKDMYNELSKRYPKRMDGVEDAKQLNSDVNYNMEELLDNSEATMYNDPDKENKHAKQGIVSFDARTVKFYDGNKAYDIEFSIATLQSGEKVAYAKKYFGYDENLTKKIQTAESRSEKSPFDQRSAKDSIAQNSEKSSDNAKFSLSDSDGKQLTAEQGGYSNGSEGASTVAIAFDSEQIKSVANEKPTADKDIRYSLSKEGETPKKHGRYHIKGEDVALDVAPVQDSVQDSTQDIAPVAESAKPKERRLAWYNHWGDKVADVPVMEDIAPSEPSLPQLRRELEGVAQQAQEAMNAGDAEALNALGQRYEELNQQIRSMEADEAARVASLEDADAPPEVDAPYYGENEAVMPDDPFENRDPKKVKDEKSYMYENPEVKPYFQAEANILLGELDRTEKAQTYYNGWIKQDMSFEFAQDIPEVYRTSRVTSPSIAALRDDYGMSYDDIRKGLNALIEDHGAENIAAAKRIEFEINDRLMKGYQDDMGNDIPANAGYLTLLNEKQISTYSDEARRSFFESVGATNIAPIAEKYETVRPKTERQPSMKRVDGDIAPVRDTAKKGEIPGQQTMLDDDNGEDGKIAKVMVGEPEGAQKKVNGWQKFRTNILDKFSVFEDLALKRKNRELMGKANYMLSSEARAQNMIGQGDDGVKSLNAIRTEVENAGQTERFYNYMYHRHNVDRMSLEEKARPVAEGLYAKFGHLRQDQLHAIAAKEITDKTTEKTAQSIRDAREYLKAIDAKNKPVFGDSVTAEKSRERVSFYEQTNPEFKRWADDVYTYVNHLRGLMVENGVISQETADLWAEMYPHYVPIRRLGKSGAAVNVPLDTGRTGINAPIKRAEGGNSDIMDMFDTIAQRTEQTYRAIAKNSFGVELKNTLGTTLQKSKASLDEVIDSVDAHEELLKKGENGANPTFTVFENGERVEFEITDAMYDALKPVSDGLRYVNSVGNTISKFHKGVLTEYNPVFSMTNAIKDAQDILINSQHAVKTYANIPTAIKHMAKNGGWYREYVKNGGEQNTYFDGKSNTFKEEDKMWKKVAGMPLRGISWWNNKIETLPRLAEYIASRKKGASVEVAMLDAARVTTNFQAGGDVAKFIDRNGATFLNASIQGFNQQVRNVREAKANGAKGWLQLAAKVAIAGLPVLLLNEALWGDDEEYEELSDYVKDSYYIVAKFDDGKFVRIPKGRAMAVIQDAFEQVKNALTGDDEVDLRNFLDIAFTNLAPNNPIDNNIIAPVVQAVSNKAWYGGDIVPTRLQDMPSAEQYDESTDSISKWLGEKTNTSPMKWNYVLNQYGGGVADLTLPYLTPEAESGGNKLIAPLTSKFTADAVMNNQNVSDFYDTVDELTKNANSAKATDEDILKYKYMNSVNSELSALYQQKREIQNSNLSDAKKHAAVRDVQEQIDRMTAESLNTYGHVNIDGVYATVGDRHYRMNKDGAWEKITDKQLEKQNEVTSGLGISASDYWSRKDEYDFEYEYPEKYTFFRENGISYEDYANADDDGKRAYTWAAENPEKYVVSKAVTGDLFEYRRYTSELYDIKADKDEDGESISGSAKEKKIEYINNLDLDYGQKIILYRSMYDSRADQETYNQDIVDYLNEREDISYKEMETILKELGFEVDSEGNIWW